MEGTTGALAPNTMMHHRRAVQVYSGKGVVEMGNIRNPYDVAAEELADVKADLVSEFTADDGMISERELGIIVQFDAAADRIRRTRGLEHALELLMKQNGRFTRYTDDVLADVGLKLEPLDIA